MATSDLLILARFKFSSATPSGEWRYWIGRTWKGVSVLKAVSILKMRGWDTEQAATALAVARKFGSVVLEGKGK